MAGGVGGNSARRGVLVSPRSSLYRVFRPESVFQDVKGAASALTLDYLDHTRVGIFP